MMGQQLLVRKISFKGKELELKEGRENLAPWAFSSQFAFWPSEIRISSKTLNQQQVVRRNKKSLKLVLKDNWLHVPLYQSNI